MCEQGFPKWDARVSKCPVCCNCRLVYKAALRESLKSRKILKIFALKKHIYFLSPRFPQAQDSSLMMLSFAILYLCLPAFACVCYHRASVNAIFLSNPQWISTMCIRLPFRRPKRIQILRYLVKGPQRCMLHHCTGQGLLLLIIAMHVRNSQQKTIK